MEIPATRIRIIQASEKLFRRVGIRSITMDDIAKELGMSKKTLYQEFRNKADIVFAVTESYFEQEQTACNSMHESAQNPIEELIMIIQWLGEFFKGMNPGIIYELQKYYPRSWHLMRNFEEDFILNLVKQNLEKGMEGGLYRSDMDANIIARIRINQIHSCFDYQIFPPEQFNTADVVIQSSELFLHGLVTMKGKKLIYKYLNRPEDE